MKLLSKMKNRMRTVLVSARRHEHRPLQSKTITEKSLDRLIMQVPRFKNYGWGDAEFPLQFNKDLSFYEANQSIFFRNTRLFLKKLVEFKDETTATSKGELNRIIVKLMFDEMELSEKFRKRTREYKRVLNEGDLFPLHTIRMVCKCAGLIESRPRKILVPENYHYLLTEEGAGQLYYILFEAYYKKFNLSCIDRLSEAVDIKDTFDFSLYRLSVICDDFQQVDELYHKIFLPTIMLETEGGPTDKARQERVATLRIVYPLVVFGLVESQFKGAQDVTRIEQVRKTSLFNRFISLNL